MWELLLLLPQQAGSTLTVFVHASMGVCVEQCGHAGGDGSSWAEGGRHAYGHRHNIIKGVERLINGPQSEETHTCTHTQTYLKAQQHAAIYEPLRLLSVSVCVCVAVCAHEPGLMTLREGRKFQRKTTTIPMNICFSMVLITISTSCSTAGTHLVIVLLQKQ